MNTDNTGAADGPETFRSGVAARLAGIPVETLRVWERRYGVVGPRISARGQRLYSAAEVRRLALIKQLLDLGHPIGSVARLTTDELTAMQAAVRSLAAATDRSSAAGTANLRVALVGPTLASPRFAESLGLDAPGRVVSVAARVNEVASASRDVTADLLIVELPTLHDESFGILEQARQRCAARDAIVLYRFAPSAIVRRLRLAGYDIVRAPANALELATLCRNLLQLRAIAPDRPARVMDATEPAARRFDEQSLAAFADASNTVYCECPRHLVELLINLTSFERYSAECANRSPADAILHRDLQQTAGHARALLENALVRVAAAEGISIPSRT